MPRKKETKNVTKYYQKKILTELVKNKEDKELIAKRYNITANTIYEIINRNMEYYQNIKSKMMDSIQLGAAECSNLALDALKSKNLNKEKPKSLAYIAETTGKLAQGATQIAVQINNNIPTNREDLLNWLKSDKSKEIIDNTMESESASNDDK